MLFLFLYLISFFVGGNECCTLDREVNAGFAVVVAMELAYAVRRIILFISISFSLFLILLFI